MKIVDLIKKGGIINFLIVSIVFFKEPDKNFIQFEYEDKTSERLSIEEYQELLREGMSNNMDSRLHEFLNIIKNKCFISSKPPVDGFTSVFKYDTRM